MSLTSSQIIAQNEQKARARYLSAVQHIDNEPHPAWFNDFLEQSVLPLLVRVGFDRDIAGSLFRISASAWKSMGPVTDPKLRLHPALARDLRKIRRDIVPHPITWIILPRAHSFLTKEDSHCLIVYLQYLNRETNLAFEKILARILIEFIGNYSLKFISSSLPKKKMMEAIFYGYAAMFWKNLKQPPPGLEDLLIFRNYLSWARAFKNRVSCKDAEKEAVVAEMEEIENKILPDRNTRTLACGKNLDASRLLITLRHGRPGINHAVRHFTMNSTSLCGSSHDQLSCRTLPRQINTLFRELRNSYDRETPRTRDFIHTFLMELKTAYNPRTVRPNLSGQTAPDDLAFTQRRMACMVQDFSRCLH
ncbi:MAG: hypothetical protein ABFR35_03750 [Thermodesulfobacteriota bacterium]